MTYRFVFTAEKSNANIMQELAASPGWQDIEACFAPDSPFVVVDAKLLEDMSYAEFSAWFSDREMYELWHETHKELHDSAREVLIPFLESQGITVKIYNEGTELTTPDRSSPWEEFVSRFPATE